MKRFFPLSLFAFASVWTVAAAGADSPRTPFDLARTLEARIAAGDGAMLPDPGRELARFAGTVDTDFDGLSDGEEHALGTNPLDSDTDGDGLPDACSTERTRFRT